MICALSLATLHAACGAAVTNSRATYRARQHFFGFENVDSATGNVRSDRVIFSWFSNTSFAVAMGGRVFLLDAFIVGRENTAARVPTTVQELVDLKPEFIFVGHGHADHAELAANIAVRTGATIVGLAELCSTMRVDALSQFGSSGGLNCLSVIPTGAAPGAVNVVSLLEPLACVTAVKHLHAAAAATDPSIPPNPISGEGDPRDPFLYPPGPPASDGITTIGTNGILSVMYQFVMRGKPNFTFTWNDTGGPLKDQAPQVLDVLRSLPKTDVQFSLAVPPPAPITAPSPNGMRDIVYYIQAVRPKIFVPGHIDYPAQFGVAYGSSPYWKRGLQRQFDLMNVPTAERPELRWLEDPDDYLRPQSSGDAESSCDPSPRPLR